MAQCGRPGERESERREQRRADRDGKSAEEDAVDAGDRDQRQEDHNGSKGRPDQRHPDFAQGAADRFSSRLPGIPVHHDVLDHHDGVVDYQPDCRRQAADPDTRIFLLGARPGVARRAADTINARAGRELVVGAHGPSMNFVNDPAEIDAVLRMIEASGANVLLVGLGAPKQEIWIASVRNRLPQVRTMMGVGATIDYEAGEVRRAPPILRRIGLEWSYRVFTEPRRYLMRYVRSSRFLWWMLMDRLGRYQDPFGLPRVSPR